MRVASSLTSGPACILRWRAPGSSPAAATKGGKKQKVHTEEKGTLTALFAQSKAGKVATDHIKSPVAAIDAAAAAPAATPPPSTTASPAKPSPSASSDLKSTPATLSAADEQMLRDFDLKEKFGPCVGPTRLQRWQRAERWGLEPPPEVRTLLETLDDEHPAHKSMLAKYNL